jgi:lipopolysaccharide transport system ATP-binding protein
MTATIDLTHPLVELERVTKVYPICRTAADYLRLIRGRATVDTVQALSDVSLRVAPGEIVGLIGHNGAGKSTLLRIIAGIAPPTSGSVTVRGKVHTLLDLSAGMMLFMSGRDNIVQRFNLLGLSPREARDKVDEVADFAELTEVIDEPIFTYSTGMRVRLAFAIVTAVQPEIFLIDEVLAVGDEFFAAKSFRRIELMAQRGQATLVASHDWTKTFRLANRIIWMENGRVIREGPPDEIMYAYLAHLNAFRLTKDVRITGVTMMDQAQHETTQIRCGAPLTVRVSYTADMPVSECAVIAGWMDAATGESVLSAWSLDDAFVLKDLAANGAMTLRYPEFPLAPGSYDFVIFFAAPGQGPFPVDYFDIWGPTTGHDTRFTVTSEDQEPLAGIVRVPVTWAAEAQ